MIDLTGQSLSGSYPVVVKQESGITVTGGLVTGPAGYTDDTAWSYWHKTNGITFKGSPGGAVCDVELSNVGDAICFSGYYGVQSSDWTVCGVTATQVHDDAVENDGYQAGVIHGSHFECFDFLSCRWGNPVVGGTPPDGTGNTVWVNQTTVLLRPYHASFKPLTYGYDQSGGFFKFPPPDGSWGRPPDLLITDCEFVARQLPARYGSLDLPPEIAGAKVQARNVTLRAVDGFVWPEEQLVNWRAFTDGLTVA